MTTKGRTLFVGVLGVLVAVFVVGQTIKTDGEVEAVGFTGNGSSLTDVNSELLDGLDSSEFAPSEHLHTIDQVTKVRTTFYLSEAFHAGDVATSACSAGFHMASKWELQDLSQLTYAKDAVGAASSGYDLGSGDQPPTGRLGWVHTGVLESLVNSTAGWAHCSGWTSLSGNGTILFIEPTSMPFEWVSQSKACSTSLPGASKTSFRSLSAGRRHDESAHTSS